MTEGSKSVSWQGSRLLPVIGVLITVLRTNSIWADGMVVVKHKKRRKTVCEHSVEVTCPIMSCQQSYTAKFNLFRGRRFVPLTIGWFLKCLQQ